MRIRSLQLTDSKHNGRLANLCLTSRSYRTGRSKTMLGRTHRTRDICHSTFPEDCDNHTFSTDYSGTPCRLDELQFTTISNDRKISWPANCPQSAPGLSRLNSVQVPAKGWTDPDMRYRAPEKVDDTFENQQMLSAS